MTRSLKPLRVADRCASVVSQHKLAENMYWLTLCSPQLARGTEPGQDVSIFLSDGSDPLLGRPFAVADSAPERGEISLCYMVVGRGTKLMTSLKTGDRVRLRGPLGNPLPNRGAGVFIAAGGAGVASFLLYAKIFNDRVRGFFFGLPGKGFESCAEKISSLFPDIKIYADDGSFGEGDSMFADLPKDPGNGCEIWASGPHGFLKAVESHCRVAENRLYYALDGRMACGYGGCLGCTVKTSSGRKRVCVDGPIFAAGEVNLDELI